MKRLLREVRPLVSKRLVGTFAAIAALLAQPLAVLPIDSAYATTGTPGSVVINEFNANNGTDWVELYNTTGSAVSLTGWKLRDSSASNKVDLSGSIAANSFLSFNFGNSLNVGGDTVRILDDTDVTVIDSVAYPGGVAVPGSGQYAARTSDGNSVWEVRTSHSRNASNATAGATLSSTLGATATVNRPVVFSSTITKAVGSTTPNVRVKTTLADPTQEADVNFEYEQGGSYYPISSTGGVTYYGAAAGFPLTTATSGFRVTFTAPGEYTATSQIVNAADGTPIGSAAIRTVTVTMPSGTRYVATDGQDSANDCTDETTACKTIQHAVNQANNGETVKVGAGTYTETVEVNKPIVLEGAQAGVDARPSSSSTRMAASANESVVSALKNKRVFNVTADNVVIDGFTVTQSGGSGASDAIKADASRADVTVKNNIVTNTTDEAIQLEAGSDYAIENNYILNPVGDGVTLSTYAQLKGENMKIANNDIAGSKSAYGSIYLYGAQDVTISGNVITTESTGIAAGSDGLPVEDVTIENNTITTQLHTAYSALAAGVAVDGNSADVTIQKNTIEQPSTATVSSAEATLPARFNLVRVGVATAANPTNVVVKYNNLSRITPVNYIYVNSGVTNSVDMTQNWWGNDGNPSQRVNNASLVAYEPWLCVEYNGQLAPRHSVDGTCADLTGPDLTVTTPATDGTIRAPGAYTLAGTVSDAISGFDRLKIQIKDLTTNALVLTPTSVTSFNGENWTFDVPVNTFTDGHQYRITFNAYDEDNNLTTIRRTVTIDNTAPNGVITRSGNSAAVTVTLGSLTESIQTPSGWTQNGSEYTRTHTANGNFVVELRDAVGNVRTLNYTISSIDDQAPVLNITSVTRNTDGTYTIVGSSNEALSSAQVSIDGGTTSQPATVSGTTWSFTTGVLLDGIYRIVVTANDTVMGNPSAQLEQDFTAVTPFVPVSQPIVDEADFIVNEVANSKPVTTTAYVAAVNTGANDNKGSILGTKTTKNVAKTTAPVVEPSEQGWKLLGMAWYWWIAIIAAVGSLGWYGLGWFRGRA